ncbi:MAG: glucose-1-phosphate adenylyltransferase [Candidatus Omnitrophica bacterium]|nr:glucose-1-phosphate adenylyltransferase [Candidatus Omnitrophota bacterium]
MMPMVLILGGGKGSRLFPLTLERSKPAIGFAGKYRMIDIPVSNCLNSGYNKIFVLTQFLSASLHGHLMETYQFDNFSKGFVQILSAEQGHERSEWFHGTADAVRQVLRHLRYQAQEHVLILSGDHLYTMDYRRLLEYHIWKKADVTVASVYVDAQEASRMGILDCDAGGQIRRLIEKPKDVKKLKFSARGDPKSDKQSRYLASMGVYMFNKQALFEILTTSQAEDFGKHILPLLIKRKSKIFAYEFDGYWRDIGTVGAYYEASMDLLAPRPAFNLFDESWPLMTRARFLPPSRMIDSALNNCLIADGCLLRNVSAERSIIGLRSTIEDGTVIKDAVLMGNDYYHGRFDKNEDEPLIGQNVYIERAIVDKNVAIGDGCRIRNKYGQPDFDGDLYYVRDGITIVRRGVVLPPDTII